MAYDISKEYEKKLKKNLETRLGRKAKEHEIINADRDADLVNETLWQLLCELEKRVAALGG